SMLFCVNSLRNWSGAQSRPNRSNMNPILSTERGSVSFEEGTVMTTSLSERWVGLATSRSRGFYYGWNRQEAQCLRSNPSIAVSTVILTTQCSIRKAQFQYPTQTVGGGTVLECVYAVTGPNGNGLGSCLDNRGNQYQLSF